MGLIFLALIFYNLTYFGNAACPDGTIESITDKTRCFSFHSEKKGFLSAEEICIKNGGNLTSVESMFQNVFISQEAMEKFTDSTSDDFWIGANRLQTPGIWGWIDGSAFTFTDWDKGQPQNVTGADCGAVKIQSGLWSAKDCFMQKPFVCAVAALNAESTTTIALTTTTTQVTSTTTTSTKATTTTIRPKPKNCPISWTYYNLTGFCYIVLKNESWIIAENRCKVDNAHLASVHSFEEAEFLANLAYYTEADGSTYNNAAIGFYTEDDNAHWQWTDGTPFDFPNWSPPEPNNPGVENCGEMYLRSMDVWKAGQFNNIPCDRTIARYICKKPPS